MKEFLANFGKHADFILASLKRRLDENEKPTYFADSRLKNQRRSDTKTGKFLGTIF
ncbi:MAG: hypothetical protein H6654_00570 [Ardenticatenaceae bacterium]|nr:hypothetical protein [Ardenticatenaceae bacterium]